MRDLTKLNRDYVWMEVSDDGKDWLKRAVINKLHNEYVVITNAQDEEHSNFKTFIKYGVSPENTWPYAREIKEPTWKPYPKMTEELKQKLRGTWIKHKSERLEFQIIGIDEELCSFTHNKFDLLHLFTNFTYLDGTPIGIEEELNDMLDVNLSNKIRCTSLDTFHDDVNSKDILRIIENILLIDKTNN
jgi:hypothetical protein